MTKYQKNPTKAPELYFRFIKFPMIADRCELKNAEMDLMALSQSNNFGFPLLCNRFVAVF